MKRTILLFAFSILAYVGVNAQSGEKNSFLGSWDIIMVALPQGDTKSQLVLNETDGKLSGVLKFGEPSSAEAPIVSPVIKDSVLTFRATLQGYDIDFVLNNEDGVLKGSMYNNMFVVTGKKSESVGK